MNLIYLDLAPAYIPFLVQATKGDGSKIDPTVDNLIIYEEGGADATFDSTTITGSPFDPAKVNTKTGLWGVMVAKTAFTAGKWYVALWEMTVDGITTAKAERYFACNSSQFKADISALALDSTVAKEANVETHVTASLNAYDPPTRAEATTDKAELIVEHDATQALINEKVTGNTSIQVISATSGSVVVSAAKAGGTFQFVRGNEISYPYGPLGKNVTGRKIYFAVKKKAADTVYVIPFTDITADLTVAATFTGLIPFTAAMTKDLTMGKYYLAINSYGSDDTTFIKPLTEATFVLDLVDRVIDNP